MSLRMEPMETISVVIPARNEERFLPECLECLQAQTYPHTHLEILLVNSASEDGTEDVMREFACRTDIPTKILQNSRGDTPNALNTGFKNATGDFILHLIAHSRIAPEHISRALRILHEKNADGVGGRIITVGSGMKTFWDVGIAAAMQSPLGLGNATVRVSSKPGWIDNPMFVLYRRDVFDRFGYIDDRLTRNQDYEFHQRCYASGAKFWFEPSIEVFYYSRPNPRQLWRQYYNAAKWRTFMIGEHFGAVRLRHLVPPIFVIVLLSSAIAAAFWMPALAIFAAAMGIYAIAIAINTICGLFSQKKPSILIALPFSFIAIHFAFGTGFLMGLAQFIVFGKKKRIAAAEKQWH